MRASVSRLGVVLSAAFGLIALALTYWQVVAADALSSDPANQRLIEAERRGVRGAILDRNGELLASRAQPARGQERQYPVAGSAAITGYHSQRFGSTELEAAFDA